MNKIDDPVTLSADRSEYDKTQFRYKLEAVDIPLVKEFMYEILINDFPPMVVDEAVCLAVENKWEVTAYYMENGKYLDGKGDKAKRCVMMTWT